jgi:hypothetical protein
MGRSSFSFAQELANSLLGLAHSRSASRARDGSLPAALEAAAGAALAAGAARGWAAFSDQELANAAWAFSKVSGLRGSRQLPQQGEELLRGASVVCSKGGPILAWGAGQAGHVCWQ